MKTIWHATLLIENHIRGDLKFDCYSDNEDAARTEMRAAIIDYVLANMDAFSEFADPVDWATEIAGFCRTTMVVLNQGYVNRAAVLPHDENEMCGTKTYLGQDIIVVYERDAAGGVVVSIDSVEDCTVIMGGGTQEIGLPFLGASKLAQDEAMELMKIFKDLPKMSEHHSMFEQQLKSVSALMKEEHVVTRFEDHFLLHLLDSSGDYLLTTFCIKFENAGMKEFLMQEFSINKLERIPEEQHIKNCMEELVRRGILVPQDESGGQSWH